MLLFCGVFPLFVTVSVSFVFAVSCCVLLRVVLCCRWSAVLVLFGGVFVLFVTVCPCRSVCRCCVSLYLVVYWLVLCVCLFAGVLLFGGVSLLFVTMSLSFVCVVSRCVLLRVVSFCCWFAVL